MRMSTVGNLELVDGRLVGVLEGAREAAGRGGPVEIGGPVDVLEEREVKRLTDEADHDEVVQHLARVLQGVHLTHRLIEAEAERQRRVEHHDVREHDREEEAEEGVDLRVRARHDDSEDAEPLIRGEDDVTHRVEGDEDGEREQPPHGVEVGGDVDVALSKDIDARRERARVPKQFVEEAHVVGPREMLPDWRPGEAKSAIGFVVVVQRDHRRADGRPHLLGKLEPENEEHERTHIEEVDQSVEVKDVKKKLGPLLHKEYVQEAVHKAGQEHLLRGLRRVGHADDLHHVAAGRALRVDAVEVEPVLRHRPPLPLLLRAGRGVDFSATAWHRADGRTGSRQQHRALGMDAEMRAVAQGSCTLALWRKQYCSIL
eukprot:scaffold5016_cov118-Isochrysis_galbana.AAC.4